MRRVSKARTSDVEQLAGRLAALAITIVLMAMVVLILGAFGIAGMWTAVFADVGVAILAILNSLRNLAVVKE